MSRYRKTIAALVGALIITIPLLDGGVTNQEWVAIVIAWATAAGVYGVPNDAPEGEPVDRDMSERGHFDLTFVTGVCVIVIAVVFVLWALGEVPR